MSSLLGTDLEHFNKDISNTKMVLIKDYTNIINEFINESSTDKIICLIRNFDIENSNAVRISGHGVSNERMGDVLFDATDKMENIFNMYRFDKLCKEVFNEEEFNAKTNAKLFLKLLDIHDVLLVNFTFKFNKENKIIYFEFDDYPPCENGDKPTIKFKDNMIWFEFSHDENRDTPNHINSCCIDKNSNVFDLDYSLKYDNSSCLKDILKVVKWYDNEDKKI